MKCICVTIWWSYIITCTGLAILYYRHSTLYLEGTISDHHLVRVRTGVLLACRWSLGMNDTAFGNADGEECRIILPNKATSTLLAFSSTDKEIFTIVSDIFKMSCTTHVPLITPATNTSSQGKTHESSASPDLTHIKLSRHRRNAGHSARGQSLPSIALQRLRSSDGAPLPTARMLRASSQLWSTHYRGRSGLLGKREVALIVQYRHILKGG